jgi:hypothetical protein
MMSGDDQVICDNCMTSRERLAQGRRILAGLVEETTTIRKQWLGDDIDTLDKEQLSRRVRKAGPRLAELDKHLDLCAELEETIENLEFVADSEERLWHRSSSTEAWKRQAFGKR